MPWPNEDQVLLLVIAHQYQAAGEAFEDYARSFEQWLDIAASFQPLLVNFRHAPNS